MSNLTNSRRIALLIVWSTLIQAWMIARNPVPAQDAVGFIQFARQLDYHSFVETLRSNTQHPFYPVLVWVEHTLLSSLWSSDGMTWIRSAQLVAGLASVLLVAPMYLLGVRLANARLSTAAVGLFCTLPVSARMGADALADSTYLLFVLTALWGCVEFLESWRPVWLFMAGLAVGVGYLSRPEALLVPAALAVTLILLQVRSGSLVPWRRGVAAVACGLAGLLCIAVPYTVSVGKLTPKGSLNLLPGGNSLFARFDKNLGRPAARTFSDGHSVPAPENSKVLSAHGDLDFGLNHRPSDKRFTGYAAAGTELVRELVEGLHYIVGLFVLIGVFFTQRRPANLLCSVLAIVFLVILMQFASKSGYIASRHVITLVCLGCFVAARGGWVLAGWLAQSWAYLRAREIRNCTGCLFEARQYRVAAVLFVMTTLCCLPRTLGSLHQSRDSHVAAGRWLFEHAATGSIVLDSRGWASLYSGLPAYDYNGARLAFEDPKLAYVVVESEELEDSRPRGETLRQLLGVAGQVVAEFPAVGSTGESVKIFAWHPDRIEPTESARQVFRAN